MRIVSKLTICRLLCTHGGRDPLSPFASVRIMTVELGQHLMATIGQATPDMRTVDYRDPAESALAASPKRASRSPVPGS